MLLYLIVYYFRMESPVVYANEIGPQNQGICSSIGGDGSSDNIDTQNNTSEKT